MYTQFMTCLVRKLVKHRAWKLNKHEHITNNANVSKYVPFVHTQSSI